MQWSDALTVRGPVCHSSSSQTVPCLLTWGEEQGKLSDMLSYASETRPCGAASCGSQRTRAKSFKDNNGTRQTCPGRGRHSRLRLGGVVAQGNRLPLDLVETFLAEVVPVSNKPKFWWTTPFPKARSVTDGAREGGQSPIGTGHGQGGVPRAEQAGSGSAAQQEVVIATARHDFERCKGGRRGRRGKDGRESVWRCMVGQGKSKPMLTAQPSMGREGGQTSDGAETGRDNTQQRAKAKALIRKFGHERMSNSNHHHSQQSRSGINKELGFGRGGGRTGAAGDVTSTLNKYEQRSAELCVGAVHLKAGPFHVLRRFFRSVINTKIGQGWNTGDDLGLGRAVIWLQIAQGM